MRCRKFGFVDGGRHCNGRGAAGLGNGGRSSLSGSGFGGVSRPANWVELEPVLLLTAALLSMVNEMLVCNPSQRQMKSSIVQSPFVAFFCATHLRQARLERRRANALS